MLELGTWHDPRFDIRTGTLDIKQSPYYKEVAGYRKALAKLTKMIGTDQIVWCLPRDYEWAKDRRDKWKLKLPKAEVIAYIDTLVWELIIGRGAIPDEFRLAWLRQYSGSDERFGDYEECKRNELMEEVPESKRWGMLLVDSMESKRMGVCYANTALIPFPVESSWVIPKRYRGQASGMRRG
jgi:hypothetical protein